MYVFSHSLTVSAAFFCAPVPLLCQTTPSIPLIRGTAEDLLEEIVGEIADEYDNEEPMVTPLEDGGFLVDGRLGVDELGEMIGVDLPDDEWDTVGGLMLGLAGRVPNEGESFEFEEHVFVTDRVQGRRVARVRLRSL